MLSPLWESSSTRASSPRADAISPSSRVHFTTMIHLMVGWPVFTLDLQLRDGAHGGAQHLLQALRDAIKPLRDPRRASKRHVGRY